MGNAGGENVITNPGDILSQRHMLDEISSSRNHIPIQHMPLRENVIRFSDDILRNVMLHRQGVDCVVAHTCQRKIRFLLI